MSLGNLKDYGNKGSNFNFQKRVLELLACHCESLIVPSYTTSERNSLSASVGQLAFDIDEDRLYVYKAAGWTLIL